MKNYLLLFLIFHFQVNSFSQKNEFNNEKTIKSFFESYNKKDYKSMRKNLFLLGRLLLNESKLKESFSEIRNAYGDFKIKKLTLIEKGKIKAEVLSERDSTEVENFTFTFNSKNRIKNFSITPKVYTYSKNFDLDYNRLQKINKIDSLVKYKNRYGNFNGCVAVMINNDVVYKGEYGVKNYETGVNLNDSSVFYIASCSKQFTAMSILVLMEEGKLKLSDTLQKYFPNLPYKNITIENLLTHTSGLPDYISLMSNYWDKSKIANSSDVLEYLIKYKPKSYYSPNSEFDYCNTGYVLLALIIEKISGKSYEEFICQNIYKPLKMTTSTVNGSSSISGNKAQNWAYGYTYSDSLKKYIISDMLNGNDYVKYLDNVCGDGNVNSSINDLIKWEIALRNNILISKESTEKMFSKYSIKSNRKIEYGYGQCINETEGFQKQVYHSGGWAGYHSSIFRLIESKISVIILTNNEYPSFNQLNDSILQILLKEK